MDALQINLTGAVLALAKNYQQRWDDKHSLEYVVEEAIVAGLEAKRRSKEYSVATENRKKFEKEIASNPVIVLDPVAMLKLMKKYGIGSSNQNLEAQVVEASEKLQAAKEAEELAKLEAATAPAVEAKAS